MAKKAETPAGKYPADDYLNMLRLSKRSENTIEGYRKVLKSYADFIGVPLNEIHRHLLVSNLLKYALSRKEKSNAGTKTNLSILHRYFAMNGVKFDELEQNAVNPKIIKEHNDKELELESIKKMMDLTDVHGRAFISFLISTGCRADETCNVLLSDVHGDCVNIRNEIAKNGHGGHVYLTEEAYEYLNLWLKERDNYIRIADARMKPLVKSCGAKERPVKDARLFAISYTSAHKKFSRLYDAVDGGKGKYHRECTIHSCRKYFRTQAAKAMHPDLVTKLMRQTGYLDNTYVRIGDEQCRKEFHTGEASLYITRADHRIQSGKLAELERENQELKARLDATAQTDDLDKLRAKMLEMDKMLRSLSLETHGKMVAETLLQNQ